MGDACRSTKERGKPLYGKESEARKIATLMQVLAPDSADIRAKVVEYLATILHPDANRSLARLAIFSEEEKIRNSAIDASRSRHVERDSTEVSCRDCAIPGYPWRSVLLKPWSNWNARICSHSCWTCSTATTPRAPTARKVAGKQTLIVREVVKLNHLRNCLLCHAPVDESKESRQTLTANMPIPGEKIPDKIPLTQVYYGGEPDFQRAIRVDVTYLRQDFSRMEPVADAVPWQKMQRFDYLVPTRSVSEEEAALFREKLAVREPGQQLSPYQLAALEALRKLTGKNTEPKAAAWRKLLGDNAADIQ
jgi:hypothetical protein